MLAVAATVAMPASKGIAMALAGCECLRYVVCLPAVDMAVAWLSSVRRTLLHHRSVDEIVVVVPAHAAAAAATAVQHWYAANAHRVCARVWLTPATHDTALLLATLPGALTPSAGYVALGGSGDDDDAVTRRLAPWVRRDRHDTPVPPAARLVVDVRHLGDAGVRERCLAYVACQLERERLLVPTDALVVLADDCAVGVRSLLQRMLLHNRRGAPPHTLVAAEHVLFVLLAAELPPGTLAADALLANPAVAKEKFLSQWDHPDTGDRDYGLRDDAREQLLRACASHLAASPIRSSLEYAMSAFATAAVTASTHVEWADIRRAIQRALVALSAFAAAGPAPARGK